MTRAWILAAALGAAACSDKPPPSMQGYVEGEYVRVAAPFAGTLLSLDATRDRKSTRLNSSH